MRRFFRWRWLLVGSGALVIAGVFAPFLLYSYRVREAEAEVAKRVAALDAAEPGWDLAATVARLNASIPPDAENAMVTAARAFALLPATHAAWVQAPRRDRAFNERLSIATAAAEDAALADCRPSLDALRPIIELRRGGRRLVIPADPINHLMTGVQEIRTLAIVNAAAAVRSAERGDPSSIDHLRASAGLPRALGNEAASIGVLVRVAAANIAATATGRVLGLSEPRLGLAELQADLIAEAAENHTLAMMRSELAFQDAVARYLLNPPGGSRSTYFVRRMYLRDHAALLDHTAAAVAAARRPAGDQQAAFASVPSPTRSESAGPLAQLFTAAVAKLGDAGLRTRGHLAATAAGVACERFRQRAGRWPESLTELPPDLLAAIPIDPFTGGPIQFRRLPDGLVVYTVGPDQTDDGGVVEALPDEPPTDFGIRLYDVAKRGVPASEPKPEPPADE